MLNAAPAVHTSNAQLLGAATLCLVGATVLAQLRRAPQPRSAHERPAPPPAHGHHPAARMLHGSAALLATSVLADSGVEHYRARYTNPGMFASLLGSAMTLAAAGRAALAPQAGPALPRDSVYASALLIGLAGTAFHLYNVRSRPGGLSWANLFYGAPLGAPAALTLAGMVGLAAQHLPGPGRSVPLGRLLCGLTGAGLAGTSAEAGLLHFRGAYQNPAMWLPVSVPPVGALLLGAAAAAPPSPRRTRFTRAWLALTGALGLAGVGFHAFGVARRMGGWRNWSQNLLAGPPLPAPPAFSALALAGIAALQVLGSERQP